MHKDKFELNLLVSQKPVREYFHQDRFFVEAKRGTEYSVKVKNHSHKRILAILSVDGIDTIRGKSGAEAESGYIVNPFSTLSVQGYRINDEKVAAFKFDEGGRSYASLVENKFDAQKAAESPSCNNGVIGLRIWEEKEPVYIPAWNIRQVNKSSFYNPPINWANSTGSVVNPIYSGAINILASGCSFHVPRTSVNQFGSLCSMDESLGSSAGYIPNFPLGTAWGEAKEDRVIKTTFVKSDVCIELELFYLVREELIKAGVDVENAKKVFISGYPEAFGSTYCKQPTNWKG